MSSDSIAKVLVYTASPILKYVLKIIISEPKILTLNSNKHENKVELFFRLEHILFCRTKGFVAVAEKILNRMLIKMTYTCQQKKRIFLECLITIEDRSILYFELTKYVLLDPDNRSGPFFFST